MPEQQESPWYERAVDWWGENVHDPVGGAIGGVVDKVFGEPSNGEPDTERSWVDRIFGSEEEPQDAAGGGGGDPAGCYDYMAE